MKNSSDQQSILIVDDDPSLLDLCDWMLTRANYTTLLARDSHEALQMCNDYKDDIPLILIDLLLGAAGELSLRPNGSIRHGTELTQHILKIRPKSRILYISAYSHKELVDYGLSPEGWPYLQKPFMQDVLLSVVRQSLLTPLRPMTTPHHKPEKTGQEDILWRG